MKLHRSLTLIALLLPFAAAAQVAVIVNPKVDLRQFRGEQEAAQHPFLTLDGNRFGAHRV